MFNRIWATPAPGSTGTGCPPCGGPSGDAAWPSPMLLVAGILLVALFAANMYFFRLTGPGAGMPFGVWARGGRCRRCSSSAAIRPLLGVIYKTIPKAPVRWTARPSAADCWWPATWQIGQYFLALFVIGEKYGAYGVIGSLIALMIWFYYAAAAVFLGGEFSAPIRFGREKSKMD